MNLRPGEKELVLIGGGGHALVTLDAARASGWIVRGFLDDEPNATLGSHARHLGPLTSIAGLVRTCAFIVAVGDLGVRRALIDALEAPVATVVHPSTWIAPSASIGDGALIGAGAVVQGRAVIGRHAIINTGAVVEHDCEIGPNAHVAPRAALGGTVRTGPDTLVGIGSCVKPGVIIGARATIGAGSVVVSDIGDGATAMGNPARLA